VLARSGFTIAGQGVEGDRGRAPQARAFTHLDTALTMIDRDAFVIYPYLSAENRMHTIKAVIVATLGG